MKFLLPDPHYRQGYTSNGLPIGYAVVWGGQVVAYAKDENEAKLIVNYLRTALRKVEEDVTIVFSLPS